MKYLKLRNDFIFDKSDLEKNIKSSNIINEFLENDARFGDSLFGRLINSSIQMLKRGAKRVEISSLLSNLEDNLQLMIDRIKFDQITKQYPTLFLKSTLEEIKNVCISTLTEEEKLKILIGWDGTMSPYNPKDPKKDIAGYYKNRKITVPCLVQKNYDKISGTKNRERLEKALSPQVVKNYLDTLSDFMDELRRAAYTIQHPNTPLSTSTSKPFNKNLLPILKKIVKINLQNENYNSRIFLKYSTFINEDNDIVQKSSNLEELQELSKKLINNLSNDPDIDIQSTPEYKNFLETISKMSTDELDILKKDGLISELEDITDTSLQTNDQSNTTINKPKTDDASDKKEIEQNIPGQSKTPPTETTEVGKGISKTDDASDKKEIEQNIPGQSKTPPTKTTEVGKGISKPQVGKISNVEPKVSTDEPKKPQVIETTEGEQKEETTEIKESSDSKYTSYIKIILEEARRRSVVRSTPPPPSSSPTTPTPPAPTPPAPAPPAPTPPAPTPPSSTTSPKKSIEDLWDVFFGSVNKILPAKMTRDDVVKLKSFKAKDIDLAFSVQKDPEPLLKIIRIFELANSIYTTPRIPSGRTDGRVWPQTYRKYSFVGSGTPGGPEKPGAAGPGSIWVYKPFFRAWKDGVYKMMAEPQFKDIFKNVGDLVESLNHNYRHEEFIFEQETETTIPKEEILKEFILDMLKLKNQADFDDYVSKAMNKFFGVKVDSSKLKSGAQKERQEIPISDNDKEKNTCMWEPFKNDSFQKSDVNKLFAIPVKDLRKSPNKRHLILFIRPIEVLSSSKVVVKFTANYQDEANINMQSLNLKKVDWSCGGSRGKGDVFFGIMKNNFSSGFQISFAQINKSVRTSFRGDPSIGEPDSKNSDNYKLFRDKISLNDGTKQNLYFAKLVYFDNDKKKVELNSKSDIEVDNEQRDKNLSSLVTNSGENLLDALLKRGKDDFGWS